MKKHYYYILPPLFILVFLILSYATYTEVKNKVISDFNRQQMLVAQQSAKGIQSFFEHYINELNYLAGLKSVSQMDRAGIERLITYYNNHNINVKSVTRVDSTGRIIFTAPYNKNALNKDISYQKHIATILKDRKPIISDVFMSIQGYQTVAYHVPVFDGKTFTGSLALTFDFKKIAKQFFENIKILKNGYAWVISENAIELYCPVPGHTGRSVYETCGDFPTVLELVDKMLHHQQGTGIYYFDSIKEQKVNRIKKHAVYYPIELQNTFWSIIIATPEKEILNTMSAFKNKLVMLLLFLFITSIFLLAYILKSYLHLREGKRRLKAEQDLIDIDKKFRHYINNAPDGVFVMDLSGNYADVNPAACELSGYSKYELMKMNVCDLIVHEDKKEICTHLAKIKKVKHFNDDLLVQKKDGSQRYWAVTAVNLNNEQILEFVKDITDRKNFEKTLHKNIEEKEILLKEIHHRVKNNLNVISSLLSLQARTISTKQNAIIAFEESINRVHSIALVHQKLYQSEDFSKIQFHEYIKILSNELINSYNIDKKISIEYQLEPANFEINTAIPCGLILNELLSNALKHAFIGRSKGAIKIILKNQLNNKYLLSIQDDGKGIKDKDIIFNSSSLGMKLVQILTEQIDGTIEYHNNQGSIFQIMIPL